MESGKYYVLSAGNNLTESMTREQILSAITQAVEGHTISDVDTGFVEKIKEQNSRSNLKFWVGTTAQYNALEAKENNCFYILTDDTSIYGEINDLQHDISLINTKLSNFNKVLWTGSISENETVFTVNDIGKYSTFALELTKQEGGYTYIWQMVVAKKSPDSTVGSGYDFNLEGYTNGYKAGYYTSVWCTLSGMNATDQVKFWFADVKPEGSTEVGNAALTKIIGIC